MTHDGTHHHTCVKGEGGCMIQRALGKLLPVHKCITSHSHYTSSDVFVCCALGLGCRDSKCVCVCGGGGRGDGSNSNACGETMTSDGTHHYTCTPGGGRG